MFYLYNCYATHVPGSVSVFILNVRIHLGYDHTTLYFFIIQVRWSDCSQTFTIASSAVSEHFSMFSWERVWPLLRAVFPPSACARPPGGLVQQLLGPSFWFRSEWLYFQQVLDDTALLLPGTSGLAHVGVGLTEAQRGASSIHSGKLLS